MARRHLLKDKPMQPQTSGPGRKSRGPKAPWKCPLDQRLRNGVRLFVAAAQGEHGVHQEDARRAAEGLHHPPLLLRQRTTGGEMCRLGVRRLGRLFFQVGFGGNPKEKTHGFASFFLFFFLLLGGGGFFFLFMLLSLFLGGGSPFWHMPRCHMSPLNITPPKRNSINTR